jgi:hypothetical protein
MKHKRILTMGVLTVLVAVIGIFWTNRQAQPVKAQIDVAPLQHLGFGILGITEGQTMRVNVVNILTPPDPNLPPDPCHIVINYRDANGNLLLNANGVVIRREADLVGGQSTALNLNADNFTRTFVGRLQLRPEVQIQQPASPPDPNYPPDPCIPTVEVINNLGGRTQFVISTLPAIQRTSTISG